MWFISRVQAAEIILRNSRVDDDDDEPLQHFLTSSQLFPYRCIDEKLYEQYLKIDAQTYMNICHTNTKSKQTNKKTLLLWPEPVSTQLSHILLHCWIVIVDCIKFSRNERNSSENKPKKIVVFSWWDIHKPNRKRCSTPYKFGMTERRAERHLTANQLRYRADRWAHLCCRL